MRAAIYARVSSAGQRDSHTIDSQLRALRPYAKAQGWTVVGEYLDDGKSAATGKLDQRDGFHRMVADADRRLFDVVLVAEVDRLTRTNSMEERAAILGPFQRNGIDIITPHGGRLDLGTFLGEFFVTMQAIVAAEDRRKIAARTKAGKDRALADGRKPQGRTPYGYDYDRETGRWSVNEAAAAVIREVYRLAVDGMSCSEIADALTARDVRPFPARDGWHRIAVYRLLRKPTATGTWTANERRRIKFTLPPIVSDEIWHAANRAILNGKLRGLRRTKHSYLLEGIAVCGECGEPMRIRSSVRQRSGNMADARYICPPCKNFHRTGEVDARVWEVVERTLASPDLIERIEAHMAEREGNRRAWADDIAKYEARLERMTKAESALLARFSRGAINEDALDAELARMAKERSAVTEQLSAARAANVAPIEDSPGDIAEQLRALVANDVNRVRVVRALVAKGGATIDRSGATRLTLQIADGSSQSLVKQASSKTYHVTLRVVA